MSQTLTLTAGGFHRNNCCREVWTDKHQNLLLMNWNFDLIFVLIYLLIICLILTITPLFVIHSEEGQV